MSVMRIAEKQNNREHLIKNDHKNSLQYFLQLWCWLRGKSIHPFIQVGAAECSTDGQNGQIHVVVFFELHCLIDISHVTSEQTLLLMTKKKKKKCLKPIQGEGESSSPSARED